MELPLIMVAIAVLAACLIIFPGRKTDNDGEAFDPLAQSSVSYHDQLGQAVNEEARLEVAHEEARRILDESNRDPMMESYRQIGDFIDKHIDTLWTKRRQMTFTDDYGQENSDRFESELNYFVQRVIPTRLIEEHISTLPFDMDPAEFAKSIVRQKLKWHNRTMNRRQNEAFKRGESVESGPVYRPDCSGVEFEQLVEIALKAKGYRVRSTPVTGDQGVDLIADKDGVTVAVQCKRSSFALGNKAIQEVAAGRSHYQADEAWVVSDAEYTVGARTLAKTNNVKLVNFFSL